MLVPCMLVPCMLVPCMLVPCMLVPCWYHACCAPTCTRRPPPRPGSAGEQDFNDQASSVTAYTYKTQSSLHSRSNQPDFLAIPAEYERVRLLWCVKGADNCLLPFAILVTFLGSAPFSCHPFYFCTWALSGPCSKGGNGPWHARGRAVGLMLASMPQLLQQAIERVLKASTAGGWEQSHSWLSRHACTCFGWRPQAVCVRVCAQVAALVAGAM